MSWPLHPEQPQTLARNNFLTPFLRLPALWETVTFAENLLCAELIGMIIIIPTVQRRKLRPTCRSLSPRFSINPYALP